MIKSEIKNKKIYWAIDIALVAVFTISMYFLIYKQAYFDGSTDR